MKRQNTVIYICVIITLLNVAAIVTGHFIQNFCFGGTVSLFNGLYVSFQLSLIHI